MKQTAILEERQTSIPQEVCKAAGLEPGDKLEWRFEGGEIRGRKLVSAPEPKRITARLVRRGDELVFEAPPGIKIEPEAIAQAVREERQSR
jgi:bifunctional DNA-binding transcriptional regulator/antitoxin component of YhaV-PrlF toxin-antitoxin module